ncbi:MAG: sigma-70 family RNA polymerase sigma factor, partial [Mycobacterium sp.]|nr:sigma-70 family RNA polymerase sigma factor [Mycobacterium sp.]
ITAWTLRVTRNLAIDTLRRQAKEIGFDQTALGSVDAESEVVLRITVLEAIGHLPEQQRRVIAMRYLLDQSQTEVAGRLGVTPGTVATHTARALKQLRSDLSGRKDQPVMQVTTPEQALSLIGTDHTVSTRITGRMAGGFTADIGVPAIYRGRTGLLGRTRWGRNSPDTIVGTVFDGVVIDVDAQQRPVVTDALSADEAAEFDRISAEVRALHPGERRPGRVGAVLPFGVFVYFDGIRGLIPNSDIPAGIRLERNQSVNVEIADTDPRLGRVSLRISLPD